MSKAHNKNSAKNYQDDLDAMLDGVNLDDFAEDLDPEGDELDRLLRDTAVGQTQNKVEAPNLDHVNKESSIEKLHRKLAAIDSSDEKKQAIDDILDDFDTVDFAEAGFNATQADIDLEKVEAMGKNLNISSQDDLSKTSGKGTIPSAMDELDDFDAFDEFGDIDRVLAEEEAKALGRGQSELTTVAKESLDSRLDELNDADDFEALIASEDFDDLEAKVAAPGGSSSLTAVQETLDKIAQLNAKKPLSESAIDEIALDSLEETENFPPDLQKIKTDDMPELNETKQEMLDSSSDLDVDDNLIDDFADDDFELLDQRADEEVSTAVSDDFQDDLADLKADHQNDLDVFDLTEDSVVATPQLNAAVETDEFTEIGEIDEDFGHSKQDVKPAQEASFEPAPAQTESIDAQNYSRTIAELWQAHQQLKAQMSESALQQQAAIELEKTERLERQAKDRRDRKELVDLIDNNRKHVPPLVYIATGVSVLSLLVGGGIVAFGGKLLTDMKELKERSVSVEEELSLLKHAAPAAPLAVDANDAIENDLAAQAKQLQTPIATPDNSAEINKIVPAVESPKEEPKQDVVDEAVQPPQLPNKAEVAEVVPAVPAKLEKPAKVSTPAAKPEHHANTKEEHPKVIDEPNHWVANLVSFKQDWYAKQKAAEFAKKGINAMVVPVEVKGETWYILRSSAFKSQDDALAFATKAKKSLNLTSVLVTRGE